VIRWTAALSVVLFLAPLARAEGDAEAKALLERLASDDATERVRAERQLEAIGRPALSLLREASQSASDPEVRARCEHVVLRLTTGTGEVDWTCEIGDRFETNPCVVAGRVIVGARGKEGRMLVRCLSADTGETIWSIEGGDDRGGGSSPIVVDGRVYTDCGDGRLYCLDLANGHEVWRIEGELLTGPPALEGGRVYAAVTRDLEGANCNLFCLDAATGKEVWKAEGHGFTAGAPAILDGRVYVGSDEGSVRCFDADSGKEVWTAATEHVHSSPAVEAGRVYVGDYGGRVRCLDAATGAIVWDFDAHGYVYSSPAIVAGRLYVGSCAQRLWCREAATGKAVWEFVTGESPGRSLASTPRSPAATAASSRGARTTASTASTRRRGRRSGRARRETTSTPAPRW